MCFVSEPQIKNIVLHFRVASEEQAKLKNFENKDRVIQKRNFFILKIKKCFCSKQMSFTVFPQKGSVIATGVKSLENINSALQKFTDIIGLKSESIHTKKIVNSTYTGTIVCSETIATHCLLRNSRTEENDKNIDISFRTQFFPAILIKWKNLQGSINLFNNGQYVIVGVNSEEQANVLYQQLCVLIQNCWMTSKPQTSCVWTADLSSIECTDTILEVDKESETPSQKNLQI